MFAVHHYWEKISSSASRPENSGMKTWQPPQGWVKGREWWITFNNREEWGNDGKCCPPKLLVLEEVTSSWWFRGTRLSNNIPIFWGVEKHDFTKFPRTKILITRTHRGQHFRWNSDKLRQAQVNGRDVSQMDYEDISHVTGSGKNNWYWLRCHSIHCRCHSMLYEVGCWWVHRNKMK